LSSKFEEKNNPAVAGYSCARGGPPATRQQLRSFGRVAMAGRESQPKADPASAGEL